MITLSCQSLRTSAIAAQVTCHQQTVRERLLAFNARGLDGLGDRPGAGRKRRITERERSTLLALVALPPPGRLVPQPTGRLWPQEAAQEEGPAQWTLNALTEAAQHYGIQIKRSQVRRILLAEASPGGRPIPGPGVPIGTLAQKNRRRLALYRPTRQRDDALSRRTRESRRPGCMPLRQAGLPMGIASKRPWITAGG